METPPKSDAANGNSNEFGGLRVILVRDEETRDKLRKELGSSSLVLTIFQSKGMEFDDIIRDMEEELRMGEKANTNGARGQQADVIHPLII
ncbi:hypothetical protein L873DRAFT_637763 [Choiromyces venosus 120613-1]|uniref:Uncharacterized protein n=1 Tax=Choiromyces venosus 120613-1 TaxID=1336337 RepID=A0A3N4JTG0_9PEZI|nr:hypothetical protein L873DRAFT_637763 [Choiromyces venosus 120613-1]